MRIKKFQTNNLSVDKDAQIIMLKISRMTYFTHFARTKRYLIIGLKSLLNWMTNQIIFPSSTSPVIITITFTLFSQMHRINDSNEVGNGP